MSAMTKAKLYAAFNRLLGAHVPGDADRYSENGRYYRVNSYAPSECASVGELLAEAGRLYDSQDPLERLLAWECIHMAQRRMSLPLDTYVVYSTYKSGWGGKGKVAVWSAHATKEEAERWHKAWDDHWTKKDEWRPGGTDYDTKIGQVRDMPDKHVAPHYLRRPDAEPNIQ